MAKFSDTFKKDKTGFISAVLKQLGSKNLTARFTRQNKISSDCNWFHENRNSFDFVTKDLLNLDYRLLLEYSHIFIMETVPLLVI